LHRINFAAEYWDHVFEYFLAEYGAGRTPNPDILCNKEIKFKAFLDYALTQGADFIATGHYTRKNNTGNEFQLLKGLDASKDQSYFLHALNQQQLAKSLFPIGGYLKSDIRKIAENAGLVTHNKKDSTGICFIGERKFKEFLNRYLPSQPGLIKTPEGTTIGEHQGLMYYTIGQRQGLGIGGMKNSQDAPWFVLAKDLTHNVLIAGQGHDHPWLYTNQLICQEIHWIAGHPPQSLENLSAKIRYRTPDQACRIEAHNHNNNTLITFEKPQWAVTPGQSIVFYQADVCLGGAIIEAAITTA
jgi:tRNA-specific 2-thiouridylase